MKNHLFKAAVVAALGLALSPVAKATDLLVGFNDLAGNAGNDYVIDLGAYTSFTTTSTFSGSISSSLFTQAFGTDANALNNVAVGAVAGGQSASGFYLFATGNPATVGATAWNDAKNPISSIPTGVYVASGTVTSPTWDYVVAESPTVGDQSGQGVASEIGNPESSLINGDVTLTLWESTLANGIGHSPTAFSEVGTLSINANASADSITYTGVNAVPEPATCGLYAAGGLLMLVLRRRLSAKA